MVPSPLLRYFFQEILFKIIENFKIKKPKENTKIQPQIKHVEHKVMLKLSKPGFDHLVEFEGIKLTPYLDSIKKPTIGIGNTYYEDGTPVTMDDPPITMERAFELARNIIAKFEDGVNKLVKVNLSQNQFDALVCFAYNVGLENLKKSTMLRLINEGKISEAAAEFPKWNKAGGKEIKGLTRRRVAEQKLFLS